MAVLILLGVKDLNNELDPGPDLPCLHQARRNRVIVHQMEDFQNQDHHRHLVRVLAIGANSCEHPFEQWQEFRRDFEHALVVVALDLVDRPAELLQARESDNLQGHILILKAVLNALLTVEPLVELAMVRLREVEEDVLQLLDDDGAAEVRHCDVERFEDVLLDESSIVEGDVDFELFFIWIVDWAVDVEVLFVVRVEWLPADVDDRLQ